MLLQLLLAPFGLAFFYAAWSILCLLKNYKAARGMGFPIVVSPVGVYNMFWAIAGRGLWPYIAKLPGGSWTRYNRRGWNFFDKYKLHQELGKIFVHVTPAEIEMHVADPSSSNRVLLRGKDFLHPLKITGMAKIFGGNIGTSEGADWQRQRKITAQPFSEKTSSVVWAESMRQASQMGVYWEEQGAAGVTSVAEDTMTHGLHVLTCAGLGISYDFRSAQQAPPPGYSMNYRDCLQNVVSNILMISFLPKSLYDATWLPKSATQYTTAYKQFGRYLSDMVKAERHRLSCGFPGESNLLSVLVQKTDEARSGKLTGVDSGLQEDEIYGNLYIFNLAGHETTAHTFGYTTYLLAAYPEWQEWARDEVDHVFSSYKGVDIPNYDECFPQLKRCLALMFETLRLYCPILDVPKVTPDRPVQVELGGRSVTIPPNTDVLPNVVALSTLPEYWGEDSVVWRPNRWIESTQGNTASVAEGVPGAESVFSSEKTKTPQRGSYIPWSGGARVCPGMKFSQVEIVAAIAGLLRNYRIEVIPRKGESVEAARKRIVATTNDSATNFTLQMNDPESVCVKVVRR